LRPNFLPGVLAAPGRYCVPRPTIPGLAFKLIESAENLWQRIRAPEQIASLLKAVPIKDGLPVTDSTPA
jgi:hypothetical protein